MMNHMFNIMEQHQFDMDSIIIDNEIELSKLKAELTHWKVLFEQKSAKCNMLQSSDPASCVDIDVWHKVELNLKNTITEQKYLIDSLEDDNIKLYESSVNSDRYSMKVNYLFKQKSIKFNVQCIFSLVIYGIAILLISNIFFLPLVATILLKFIR